MSTPPTFPVLPGQGFSVTKAPVFSTRVASHVSGREVRQSLFSQTLYDFTVTFDGLDSSGIDRGLGLLSLQTLIGFFLECQGQFGTFLYVDPSDSIASGQYIGTADGSTTTFTFQRTLGAWTEIVPWVTEINNVYVNGSAQAATNWSGAYPNSLTFDAAPASGALISADFVYAFVCRFSWTRRTSRSSWRACGVSHR